VERDLLAGPHLDHAANGLGNEQLIFDRPDLKAHFVVEHAGSGCRSSW